MPAGQRPKACDELIDARLMVRCPARQREQVVGQVAAAGRDQGLEVICARARRALRAVPGTAVLAGLSMGAGVIGSVWGQRRATAGLVLLHGIAPVPASARPGLPVQVHLARDDPFAPGTAVARWQADAARAGLAAQVHAYPGAGHFYTDPRLADYHAAAAGLTWRRVAAFLDAL